MTHGRPIDYARLDYQRQQHHIRFVRFVEALPRRFWCPLCGGHGGHTEVVDLVLGGPWFECGLCEGLGYTTPQRWSLGMRICKEERARRLM